MAPVLGALVLIGLSASPLRAQWYVSGSLGASEELDATTAGSVRSFRLGLLGVTNAGRLQVTGGIPLQPAQNLLWGFARVSTSPFIGSAAKRGLGLQPDLAAEGYVYHDPAGDVNGAGGLLTAEPYLAFATRSLHARLGGGVRAAGTHAAGDGSAGSILPSGEKVSTATTAGVAAADVRFGPSRGVRLRGRGEALFLDGSTLPHAELTVIVGHPHGTVWAGVDHWESDEKRETGWTLGASLDLTAAFVAQASVGRSTGDPLFGTEPRDTWSVGLRYRFAERPGRSSAVALTEYEAGAVQLRVPADAGEGRISVAGSFNGWRKVPMQPHGGDWTVELSLAPGYYEVAFVDETGRWFVPEGMNGRRSDGMGGWIMVLVVR